MKIPFYHMECEDHSELRTHRKSYAHLCCICNLVMPNYMVHHQMTFRIFRNNYVRLFNVTDDHMSTTSSGL